MKKPRGLRSRDELRSAFRRAAHEAAHRGSGHIGPELLLWGIAATPGTRGADMLNRLGVNPRDVCSRIDAAFQHSSPGDVAGVISTGSVVPTDEMRRVVEAATLEARHAGLRELASDAVILGLLVEGRGTTAARVLGEMGVTLDRVRAHLASRYVETDGNASPQTRERSLRGARPGIHPELDGARTVFSMEIDDTSDLSIYEQIVARVQEHVATAVLTPGDRLPPVRQLADRLDIAPGTVARAYAELESRGVIVTDGARGTRVADQGRSARSEEARRQAMIDLLRPVAVAAFHLGASTAELHAALDVAAHDIFRDRGAA